MKYSLIYRSLTVCCAAMTGILLATGIAYSATLQLEGIGEAEQSETQRSVILDNTSGLDTATLINLRAAATALADGEIALAVTLARSVTDAAPDNPEGWHVLGIALANLGEFDNALQSLEKASGKYSKNAEPLIVMGEILVSLDRHDEARSALTRATEVDPGNWRAFEILAALDTADGDTDGAIQNYQQIVLKSPEGRILPWARLSQLQWNTGDESGALETMRRYTDQNPTDAAGFVALGRIETAAESYEAALASFQRAVELAPDDRLVALGLARVQRAVGDMDAARNTLRAAAERYPDDANVAYELGSLLGLERDYEGARAAFTSGLETAPGDPTLLRAASRAEFRLGDVPEALALAQKIAPDQTTPADRVWLATLLEREGDVPGALAEYSAAIEGDPKNWLAANNLAALLAEDDPQRAVEVARLAVEQVPDQTDVQDTLGWALFNAGDLVAARAIYDQIATEDVAKATYLYRLGRVMIAQGDVVDGKKRLQEALDLDPNFAYSEDAKKRLSN